MSSLAADLARLVKEGGADLRAVYRRLLKLKGKYESKKQMVSYSLSTDSYKAQRYKANSIYTRKWILQRFLKPNDKVYQIKPIGKGLLEQFKLGLSNHKLHRICIQSDRIRQ